MKAYSYKDSGIEWLGAIPSHWKADRIKDKTLSLVGGDWGSDPDSKDEGDPVIILRVADLEGINFSSSNLTIRKIKKSSYESRKVTDNSLIIEKSGGGEKQLVGRVGNPSSIKANAICSNFMANITFDNTVDISFMSYMFSCLYNAKLQFSFIQQTTGIQNLNVNYYLTRHIPIPPLSEQKAIVNFLDKAIARIDRIISIKEEQLGKTSRLRESIIDRVLTSGLNDYSSLDDINNGIKSSSKDSLNLIKLKYITNRIGDGLHATPDYTENEKYFFVNGNNLVDGFIKPKSNTKTVNEEEYLKFKLNLSDNTVLMSINGTIGTLALYNNEEVVFGKSIAYMDALDFVNKKYLMFFLQTSYIRNMIAISLEGTTIKNLSLDTIRNLKVLLPNIDKQLEIVKYLENYTNIISTTQNNLSSQIRTLQSYRKSLIHECVTGKKQVTDRVE